MPRNLRLGLGLLAAWVAFAVLGPVLLGGDPTAMDLMNALHPPSFEFPLGTDSLGRGVLTRIVFGTHIDLEIGLFSVLPAFVIGTVVGTLAGYFGGIGDTLAGATHEAMSRFGTETVGYLTKSWSM